MATASAAAFLCCESTSVGHRNNINQGFPAEIIFLGSFSSSGVSGRKSSNNDRKKNEFNRTRRIFTRPLFCNLVGSADDLNNNPTKKKKTIILEVVRDKALPTSSLSSPRPRLLLRSSFFNSESFSKGTARSVARVRSFFDPSVPRKEGQALCSINGNRGKSSSIEYAQPIFTKKRSPPDQNYGTSETLFTGSTFGSPGRGYRNKRIIANRAGSASNLALAAPPPPQGLRHWWSKLWASFVTLCAKFAAQLQGIQIGPIDWLDILTMLRIVIFATGALGAYIVSKRAWGKIREHAAGGKDGGGGEGGPMQVLARGATCMQSNMGPWSISDLALGLTAMAKVTEKAPPPLPGKEVSDISRDSSFLLRAQHYRALSEAVYVSDSASFSLLSNLPESALVAASWEPSQESFRPAYAVFVDAPYGAVVLAVKGTSHVIDMLLNSGTSPEPFGNGFAHGGFVHATEILYKEVLPHIEKAFRDHGESQSELKLVIVGHSMGAAVGSLVALKLREKFEDLQCWGFCPPACMSLNLAKECKSFTTSFVAGHDLVPRFSLCSVEKLRSRIQKFDWDEVERVAGDDEDWKNIKKGLETFRGIQQAQGNAMEKVKKTTGADFAMSNSEAGQKVKDLGQKALKSETAEKVKDLGNGAKDFIEGNDNKHCEDGRKDTTQQNEEEQKVPPLHPPGRLLVLGSDPPGCGKLPEQRSNVASQRNYGTYPTFDEAKNVTWRMHEAEQEDFEEIVVSPWCVSDHMLGNMCEALSFFQSQTSPAILVD